MKTSIFFLSVFAVELLFGDLDVNWLSWFLGLATGVSVVKLLIPYLKE